MNNNNNTTNQKNKNGKAVFLDNYTLTVTKGIFNIENIDKYYKN